MLRFLAALVTAALLLPSVVLADGPVKVVASFSIMADITRNVGGDRVAVTALVGPDQDAHVFEPKPADARAIAEADLVVVSGLGFEGFIERLVKASKSKGRIVVASQGVATMTMVDEDHGGRKVTDPHAWQDLANAAVYANNVRDALIQADPAGAEVYRANAEAYVKKAAEVDAWIRQRLGKIPQAERRIITSHDAFGYFGKAYGVTLLSPVGVTTESEASAKGVAQLIRQIKQTKVKAVFVENVSDPRLVERIAKETGAVMGGRLYSDALSGPNGPAATYLDMFKSNVELIAAALEK